MIYGDEVDYQISENIAVRYYENKNISRLKRISNGRGISDKGRKYGTEYHSVLVKDNIKFVKYNFGNTTVPLETMSADKRRIYATINNQGKVKFITGYSKNGKLAWQIDVSGKAHYIDGKIINTPHIHIGNDHVNIKVKILKQTM